MKTRATAGAARPGAPSASVVRAITDDAYAWQLDRHWYFRLRAGLPVERLIPPTEEASAADASAATSLLARVDAAAVEAVTDDDHDDLAYVRAIAERAVVFDRLYWQLPAVTPYRISGITIVADLVLAQYTFDTDDDVDRYLGLVHDLAQSLRALADVTAEQPRRGMSLPFVALPGVVRTLRALPDSLSRTLVPEAARLTRLSEAAGRRVAARARELVDDETRLAIQAIMTAVDAHRSKATDQVGLHAHPGGVEAYLELIAVEAATPAMPDELHELGLEECHRLSERMTEVRQRLGHRGDEGDFHRRLGGEPRLYAASPEEVADRLERYIHRVEERVTECFALLPTTPYGVARLDPALEGGLTFGYYEPATPNQPVGLYRYNGSNLRSRSMLTMAAVIYHELIPGHHFHVARQSENQSLHPLRRDGFFDVAPAYMEGWAEYAADLGWRLGLYDDDWDAYGRLAQERLTATRLVVDTAVNTGRWTLGEAQDFMRRNVIDTEPQIQSEALRYATDVPAQALAYRTGYRAFTDLRASSVRALGDRFDEKQFHEWVVSCGSLPLSAVAARVHRQIGKICAAPGEPVSG
jgi:uncharacterized protein (DUF885 family)